jgi:hypothetical protein
MESQQYALSTHLFCSIIQTVNDVTMPEMDPIEGTDGDYRFWNPRDG